jgi:hypothetical protein
VPDPLEAGRKKTRPSRAAFFRVDAGRSVNEQGDQDDDGQRNAEQQKKQ